MLKAVHCTMVLLAIGPSYCYAMQIVHESLENVLLRTRAAVVADVLAASQRIDGPYWRELTLHARIVKTLFGEGQEQQSLSCQYSEGRPHKRGETSVSPLVSGSGAEFSLKKGDRVILLLANTGDDVKECRVLRVEALQNEEVINRHRRRAK